MDWGKHENKVYEFLPDAAKKISHETKWILNIKESETQGTHCAVCDYSISSKEVNKIYSNFEHACYFIRSQVFDFADNKGAFDEDGKIIGLNRRIKEVLFTEGQEKLWDQITAIVWEICTDIHFSSKERIIPTLTYKSEDETIRIYVSDSKISIRDFQVDPYDRPAFCLETNIHNIGDSDATYYFLLEDNYDAGATHFLIDVELERLRKKDL